MRRGRVWRAVVLGLALGVAGVAVVLAVDYCSKRFASSGPDVSGILILCPPSGQCQLHKARNVRFRDGYVQFDTEAHAGFRSSFRWFLFPGELEELFPKSKSKDG